MKKNKTAENNAFIEVFMAIYLTKCRISVAMAYEIAVDHADRRGIKRMPITAVRRAVKQLPKPMIAAYRGE